MRAGRLLTIPVRALGRCLLVALVVALVAGCQADLAITAKVERDGSGTLAVGVGLDDAALARLGSFEADVRLADLAAAGWTVAPPQREADGLTWLRATRSFADPQGLAAAVAEINGPDGLVRGFTFTRTEDGDTTYRLQGTVDPTRGLATFGDPELAGRLPGGDPFAGLVQEIEQQEGRPATDMVTIDVTAQIADGTPMTWHPSFTDATPTALDVSLVDPKPASILLLALVVAGLVVAAVVVGVVLTRARRNFAPVDRS